MASDVDEANRWREATRRQLWLEVTPDGLTIHHDSVSAALVATKMALDALAALVTVLEVLTQDVQVAP